MNSKIEETVKEILLNEWDPIGVKSNPKAKTEYDTYALRIVGMLYNGTDEAKITAFLKDLIVNNFGLNYDEKLTKIISKKLISIPTKK